MIKNNFRILKKQYAYLQTILKTPVKFQKDWPKTVGGVADTRKVVGADGRTDGRTDRQTDGRTDTQNFGGYNIIPRHFLVAGHKNHYQQMCEQVSHDMSRDMTKPTNWLCTQRRLWSAWASTQSDQSSAWRNLGSLATHSVHSKDSDQTGWMPRLIWVFAGRTVTLLILSCRGSYSSFHKIYNSDKTVLFIHYSVQLSNMKSHWATILYLYISCWVLIKFWQLYC